MMDAVHSPEDAGWLPLLTFVLEIRCRVRFFGCIVGAGCEGWVRA